MRKLSLSDTFKMARLMKHGNITEIIKTAYADGKKDGADAEHIGMSAMLDILCSCSDMKVEEQLYDLLAGVCEKTAEDIKNQSLEQTFEDIKKICQENNIVNFLRAAGNASQKVQH